MSGTAGPEFTALPEAGGAVRAVPCCHCIEAGNTAGGDEMRATELYHYIQSRSLAGSSASPGRISAEQPMTRFSFHRISKQERMCVRILPITAKYLYSLKPKITTVTYKHGLHRGLLVTVTCDGKHMAYTRCFVCIP